MVRAALNRGEAYRTLYAERWVKPMDSILRGASDLEVAIWNDCARDWFVTPLSFTMLQCCRALMEMKELEGDLEAVAFICGLSPAACQHLILTGRYEFHKGGEPINMAEMLELMKKILKKHVKRSKGQDYNLR